MRWQAGWPCSIQERCKQEITEERGWPKARCWSTTRGATRASSSRTEVGFSAAVVLICAAIYFIVGLNAPEGIIVVDLARGIADNGLAFLSCLYFSVVTFTTLGYGDITPTVAIRTLAGVEALVGLFSIALFVVVFVKRMTR